MHSKNIVGLALGVICVMIGVYLLVTGYQHTNGTAAKIKHKITGSHPTRTRNYMIGGIIFVVVGCGLVCFSRPRKR